MKKQLEKNHQRLSEESLAAFQREIEEIRFTTDTYSEAIAAYCERVEADIEDVIPLVGPSLIQKMQQECVDRRLIKRQYRSNQETLDLV